MVANGRNRYMKEAKHTKQNSIANMYRIEWQIHCVPITHIYRKLQAVAKVQESY